MDKQKILKRIRTIELQTRELSSQVFSGNYQSAFKGRGMSFSEVRSYQIGDDVRSFDWNVTARLMEPYVKVFEEERELSIVLVIDVSSSMYFGQTEESKISLAVELAATIGFSAAKRNDKVAAVFISDSVEYYIPSKKGIAHIYFILEKLIAFTPKSGLTNLDLAISNVRKIFKQRGVCIVISDFSQENLKKDEFLKTAKKHDLIAFQVYDEGEEVLPSIGFVQWQNAETNTKNWIDSSSPLVQKEYKDSFRKKLNELEEFFYSNNIQTARFETGKPVFPILRKFFASRK